MRRDKRWNSLGQKRIVELSIIRHSVLLVNEQIKRSNLSRRQAIASGTKTQIIWRINPKGKGLVLKTSSSESHRVWFRDPHPPPIETPVVAGLDADKKHHGILRHCRQARKSEIGNADSLKFLVEEIQLLVEQMEPSGKAIRGWQLTAASYAGLA